MRSSVASERSFESVRHGLCSWLWTLCVHPTRYLLLALFRSNWLTLSGLREQEHDIRQAAAGAAIASARCRKKAKEAEENQGCATEHSTARSVSPALCLLPCGLLIVAVAPAVAVPANMSSTTCVGTRVEIIGLQKRPDMNGVAGTCVEYDQTEQRWDVKVLIGESTIMYEAFSS